MSTTTEFLLKHESIVAATIAKLGVGTEIRMSEQEMSLGQFPAIGIFLGTPIISRETLSFVPIEFTFMLVCADIYDQDDPTSQQLKQYTTYEALENVISKMNFEVASNPEPMISIAIGEGAFITGWTTMIKNNA